MHNLSTGTRACTSRHTSARWTSPCTRAREPVYTTATSHSSSLGTGRSHGTLWAPVDQGGTEKSPPRWDDGQPSTIHSTYYNYYLNFVLLEVTESETA